MVALNFQKQFAGDVEDGVKRRSIRAPRKDGRDPKAGDTLQLYTGMRTVSCRLLGKAECRRVRKVKIDHMGIEIDGRPLYAGDAPAYQGAPDPDQWDGDFARADGFSSFSDMVEWFGKTHSLPFVGNLIEWDPTP